MKARLRRLVTQGDKNESCFHDEEEHKDMVSFLVFLFIFVEGIGQDARIREETIYRSVTTCIWMCIITKDEVEEPLRIQVVICIFASYEPVCMCNRLYSHVVGASIMKCFSIRSTLTTRFRQNAAIVLQKNVFVLFFI